MRPMRPQTPGFGALFPCFPGILLAREYLSRDSLVPRCQDLLPPAPVPPDTLFPGTSSTTSARPPAGPCCGGDCVLLTIHGICLGWCFFRLPALSQALRAWGNG